MAAIVDAVKRSTIGSGNGVGLRGGTFTTVLNATGQVTRLVGNTFASDVQVDGTVTKSPYKKNGEFISHTEWHRCVVFGKLSEFAKTLSKGAHIHVEGELRSREYDSKKTDSRQRVWEIRVSSILTLDRTEKSAPEDQDVETQEDVAA